MGYSGKVQRSIDAAVGKSKPIGYVFMIDTQVKGPLRQTRAEAVQDAVEAREAHVDVQYGRVFLEPLTWIAPIWP
ncbi:hypothetical protein BV98_000558 [Sphingobium herbicidovorans NBRC 16415]|uniref:Uncharacterized protein n=1 Tax=Sphingobium herbicidovorans (strain ATCC 700291 / DSM 11019 / CCUG 56400 / KCTC 2939 / LMG 18315 / NBRC 16415 / MH) TaxID=1219045 RepID=A0A086PE82_SPHHM|nr:hypothetical protein [Sphingobium herbicidovorans]KFG91700.1 hypothetical protein BV98_000558 [Sphingobium herbicidovorans NBRC 16415]